MIEPFRRMFVDIETSPNIGFFWSAGHDQRVPAENIIKERAIICIAWKWQGEDKVHTVAWNQRQSDKKLLVEFIAALAEADEVVAHNGTRFDLPWQRARAVFHNLRGFPDVKLVDTLRIAWTKFRFNDNRLDYLAKFLGLGAKISTGFNLWRTVVLDNDRAALKRMVEYCAHDVVLLERVYERLAPYDKPKSHVGVLGGKPVWVCPRDGSTNVRKNKTRTTPSGALQHIMRCNDCGGYYSISNTAFKKYEQEKSRYVPRKTSRRR